MAEGFKKRRKADKLRFYHIAPGSVEESRTYLILARDLEYGGFRAKPVAGRGQQAVRGLFAGHSGF